MGCVLLFLPIVLAALLLAAAGSTDLPQHSRWPVATLGVAVASGAILGALAIGEVGVPGTMLPRDVITLFFCGFVIPGVEACYIRARRNDPATIRVVGGLVIGLGLLPAAFILLLFVRCTSGHCL